MRRLSLNNNNISVIDAEVFATLHALEWLELDRNPITSIAPDFAMLEFFDVSGEVNDIFDVQPDHNWSLDDGKLVNTSNM